MPKCRENRKRRLKRRKKHEERLAKMPIGQWWVPIIPAGERFLNLESIVFVPLPAELISPDFKPSSFFVAEAK